MNVFFKKVVFIFIIHLTVCSSLNAQNVINLNKDSLPYLLENNWLHKQGNVPGFEKVDFNDIDWQIISPKLEVTDTLIKNVDSVHYFRCYFRIDTSLLFKSICLQIDQQGASEIYLDGGLIKKYGKILSANNSIYFNPLKLPLPISLKDTGVHVLAVKYANFNASNALERYWRLKSGFSVIVNDSENVYDDFQATNVSISVFLTLMMGIFFTLFLLHFLIYLYDFSFPSNLFFCLLMLMIALTFSFAFIAYFSSDPNFVNQTGYFYIMVFSIGFLSLSRFLHSLFGQNNKIFFIVLLIIMLSANIARFANSNISTLLILCLCVLTLIEAIIIIIRAIIQKKRGARIIGLGVLFSSVFILAINLQILLSGGHFEISGDTTSGLLLIIGSFMAILGIPFSMSFYLAWNFSSINKELKVQLQEVSDLSQKMLEQEIEKKKILENRKVELEAEVKERTADIQEQKNEIEKQNAELIVEKRKSDELLLNILPEEIAEELKLKGEVDAKSFDHVTVLFTDFVNFTGISATLSPKELVNEIHQCFKAFDAIIETHGLEKIKTIGDAYMAVCGLPMANDEHAVKTIKAAIDINAFVTKRHEEGGPFQIRIGLNSGSVVAGIVGVKKFAYDIWGDAVNTAARIEQNSEAGKINMSGSTYELVKNHFTCQYRGKINAKNKGDIDMYFLVD